LKIFISFQGWNNDDDDQYIKLRDQTHPTITFIPAAKSHIENQRSLVALVRKKMKVCLKFVFIL
jgi:hypothetical protein